MKILKNTLTIPPSCMQIGGIHAHKNRWVDTNLVRWDGAYLVPIGGWTKVANVRDKIDSWQDLTSTTPATSTTSTT